MKNTFLFIVGGILYLLIELLFRGHTHWLMFFVGGFCFILAGAINNYIDWDMPFPLQQFIGSILITAVELISGFVLNIMLKLNIWDYSNMPLNFLGQICLPFSIGWFFLSAIAIVLDDYLRYWLFHEQKPKYRGWFNCRKLKEQKYPK